MEAPKESRLVQFSNEPGNVIWPAIYAGVATGTFGAATGAVLGVIRGAPPGLTFALGGIRWFIIGSVFSGTRTSLLHLQKGRRGDEYEVTPRDRTIASTIAGTGAGGALALLGSSRRSVIPQMIFCTGMGFVAQKTYDYLDAEHTKAEQEKLTAPARPQSWMHWMASFKWSPVKEISDNDYDAILQERALRLDAEIALIDERIEKLKNARDLSKSTESAAGNVVQTE